MGLSYVDSEIDLREGIRAKSEGNEVVLDTMWKTIKQKAQISEKAVTDIKELNSVYSDLIEGRSGGSLFKMVTENYPDLGKKEVADLYKELMASVEAERKIFKRDQLHLRDLIKERDALIKKPLSKFMLGIFGGEIVEFKKKGHPSTPEDYDEEYLYTWVTSKATQNIVATGQEEIGTGPGLFDDTDN